MTDNIFPTIEHINDIWPLVKDRPEIVLAERDNGCKVICYQISDGETFPDMLTRECRGITFGPDDKILIRPIHKFFNMGERESTLRHNLDFDDVYKVYDKRDGSMINMAILNDELVIKSKMSFESDVAIRCTDYLRRTGKWEWMKKFISVMQGNGISLTWEFTSPKNLIVIPYEDEELRLLHARETISGRYGNAEQIASEFGVPFVDVIDEDINTKLDKLKDEKFTEGVIIQFNNGDMVKCKTEWYCELHHNVTFLRERDIAKATIEEYVDDVKANLSQVKPHILVEVEKIENRAHDLYYNLVKEVEDLAEKTKDMSNKEFHSVQYKDHPLRKLIGYVRQGKTPDYKKHFFNYIWKQNFTLEPIEGAMFNDIDDIEVDNETGC